MYRLKMLAAFLVASTSVAFRPHSPLTLNRKHVVLRAEKSPRLLVESEKSSMALQQPSPMVEDAAYFSLSAETLESWAIFAAAVSVVLGALYVLWIRSDTGYCDDYLALFEALDNPHLGTAGLGLVFAFAHSGLAALRPYAEEVVGPRTWRVLFALVSLPLAYAWIVFFVVHRYDGAQLWTPPQDHSFLWVVNFVSFFFLYPSTFNLKEVAAVDKPKLHMWGTGVARITRHPQAFGQLLWSLAHGALIGTSVTALTMAMLVGHHAFSIWHGDKRLEDKYGDEFLKLKETTDVIPFKAILEGRQQLPPDYWTEWVRGPYAVVAVGTIGAYFAHPYMIAGAALFENTGLVPGGLLN